MRLRTIRTQQGLSLDELGRRVQIERTRLSRAERGYSKLSEGELERLASALDVSVEILSAAPREP